jgi:ribosomal protein S18 acetylase RimI-like enzyme
MASKATWEADRVDIIQAGIADVGDAAPLFATYREFYGEPHDLEASTAFLTKRIGRGESVVLLARDGDRCVGFVQVYPAFSSTALAPIWILNDLFVDDSARGSGAVDRLLATTAELAVTAGCVAIELATQLTNHRAQAVYARHGYVADEEFRHYEKPLREA